MHTAHIILVKADDHEEAIGKVKMHAHADEGNFADWSDWSIVGGDGIGEPRYTLKTDGEDWDGASEYAVSLEDEADLFYKVLNEFEGYRQQEFDSIKEHLKDFDLTSLEVEMDGYLPDVYQLLKLARLANGEYSYASRLFDLEHWCITTKYFKQEVAEGNNNWFAVLVDFHF